MLQDLLKKYLEELDEDENKDSIDDNQEKDKHKDSFDKVDNILADIDMTELDDGQKLELIEALIDTAQNQEDGNKTFSEFMDKLLEIVDSFEWDGKDIEEEETIEDEVEETAEELENEEEPATEPEEPEEPNEE